MIEVKITIEENEQCSLMEVKHVSELKRMGVPMRGNMLVSGVETGYLTLSDNQAERTYTWVSEAVEKRKNPFSKRFRIRRFNTIGETWYEVQEWKWYWPFWDTRTHANWSVAVPIRYKTLYEARESVRFQQRSEEPHHAIVDEL